MWIHEGFTTYSESVFVECRYGYDKAMQYINGAGKRIMNAKPIIGIFGVNKRGADDMYYKGALMLNTLRHIVNNDEKWWKLILDYATHFKKQIIDTKQVVDFFNKESGLTLTPVFNQYLRYANIPVLQLKIKGKNLEYRWQTDEPDFTMPVDITTKDKTVRLAATNTWQSVKVSVKKIDDIEVATNKFYIKVTKL